MADGAYQEGKVIWNMFAYRDLFVCLLPGYDFLCKLFAFFGLFWLPYATG